MNYKILKKQIEKCFKNQWLNSIDSYNIKCILCGEKFNSEVICRRHITNKHNYYLTCVCKICGLFFKDNYLLRTHIRNTHRENKYICDICDDSFMTMKELISHRKMKHNLNCFECKYCEKKYKTTYGIKTHMKKKHPDIEKLYRCKICEMFFDEYNDYSSHKKYFNNKEIFYNFRHDDLSLKYSRSRHDVIKNMKIKYNICNICNSLFKNKYIFMIHFISHIKTHFLCEICFLGYRYNHHLMEHNKIMHTKKPLFADKFINSYLDIKITTIY